MMHTDAPRRARLYTARRRFCARWKLGVAVYKRGAARASQ